MKKEMFLKNVKGIHSLNDTELRQVVGGKAPITSLAIGSVIHKNAIKFLKKYFK
ncbi:hypothetical protein [Lactiplantibacillus songbeiensis]|uniref:Bacteriocin n=2 Tax=Lactiplantibacillus songbeiensis TaxID=2559920 RepID=A0ABW4C0Q0_9LACO